MSKTTNKKPAKAKTAKAAQPAAQVKKDAKGRFWLVPKDGGAEQGPFITKQEALDAKAGNPAPAVVDGKAKAKKAPKAKQTKEPKKAKKVSAIDAAAQVLARSKEPMNCLALVEGMATQGVWSSPGGKTPHATLYSAIIREIAVKGKEARFEKKDRGVFAAKV